MPPAPLHLDPDRLFPPEPAVRALARRLYEAVRELPILSPHGHLDPQWFADDRPFADPVSLLLTPDHYLLRMLYSRGVPLEALGIPARDGAPAETDPRVVWHRFAAHYHLFRGTPSRLWLDTVFHDLFGLRVRLAPETADLYYEHIADCLSRPEFRPRALYQRFRIEVLATTDSPLDDLAAHDRIRASGFPGRVIPTFRPDPVVDPEDEAFGANLDRLGELTGEDTGTFAGYLAALAKRRAHFRARGATATDHGPPSAATADLSAGEKRALFDRVRRGRADERDAERFRAQMLTEMAALSREDGLVMQLHPGSFRNHNPLLLARFGRDRGADIPVAMDYTRSLRPLLARFGNDPDFTLIAFTLDESTLSRELAPLAGHYPALLLGPAWWFLDSPEGMRRFRELTTETAGFYNTVGFVDDSRSLLSIPARHDVARRVDCAFLARLVADGRLAEDEALEIAVALAVDLPRRAYRL